MKSNFVVVVADFFFICRISKHVLKYDLKIWQCWKRIVNRISTEVHCLVSPGTTFDIYLKRRREIYILEGERAINPLHRFLVKKREKKSVENEPYGERERIECARSSFFFIFLKKEFKIKLIKLNMIGGGMK